MTRSSFGAVVLGAGIGFSVLAAVMLVVTGYRVDERGENPYDPELYVQWGALFGGAAMAAVGLLLSGLSPTPKRKRASPARQS